MKQSMKAATFQRFEAKYLISEAKAFAIAAFIQPFVQPDQHAQKGAEYLVDSIYWDAPDLRLYTSSLCGDKNRFKLRVRSYGQNGNGHVLLEVKRRLDQVIRKERVWLETSAAEDLMRVSSLSRDKASSLEQHDALVLHRFRDLAESLGAVPTASISYTREAYVAGLEDEPLRVTFDRDIVCVPASSYANSAVRDGILPFPVITSGVVLEIKFTDRFPFWVSRTVERFDLQRQSVSKYVLAVNALKRQGFEVGRYRGASAQ